MLHISGGAGGPASPGLRQKAFCVTPDVVTSPSFSYGYSLGPLGFKNLRVSFSPTEFSGITDLTKVKHKLKSLLGQSLKYHCDQYCVVFSWIF